MKKKILKLSIVTSSTFEGYNYIGKFSRVHNCAFGFASYIGSNCKFISADIGRFCSIGSNVKIVFGTHPTKQFVSTHPIFYSKDNPTGLTWIKSNSFNEFKYADEDNGKYVKIENDVWIGDNALIMQGVTIHNGAIIGAGSIVTHDVNAYEIVAGVPAKNIGYRFSPQQISVLLNDPWWNKELSWIEDNCLSFSNIDSMTSILNNLGD